MSRHQYDLIQCMKQPGTSFAQVCPLCDGRCPICDSYVKPTARVRTCQDCSLFDKCILCNAKLASGGGINNGGVTSSSTGGLPGSAVYYCLECVLQEKDREGCPRILNVGGLKADMVFNKKVQLRRPIT